MMWKSLDEPQEYSGRQDGRWI